MVQYCSECCGYLLRGCPSCGCAWWKASTRCGRKERAPVQETTEITFEYESKPFKTLPFTEKSLQFRDLHPFNTGLSEHVSQVPWIPIIVPLGHLSAKNCSALLLMNSPFRCGNTMISFTTIPSGKLSHNYGKSPFLVGELTISTGPFLIAMWVYQRVNQMQFYLIMFQGDFSDDLTNKNFPVMRPLLDKAWYWLVGL